MVDALGDVVAVFKPQSAFFEAHGSAGVAVLERTIAAAQAAGALVIVDAKRGDIGSTMAAYADAYLADGSPLAGDALTVSPYLGFGSLQPAFDLAHATGRGLYVLARTSNPEGGDVQAAVRADGRSVVQGMVDAATEVNAATGQGAIGLVVGATHDDAGCDLNSFNGSILAPGIGAQGGTIEGSEGDLRGRRRQGSAVGQQGGAAAWSGPGCAARSGQETASRLTRASHRRKSLWRLDRLTSARVVKVGHGEPRSSLSRSYFEGPHSLERGRRRSENARGHSSVVPRAASVCARSGGIGPTFAGGAQVEGA